MLPDRPASRGTETLEPTARAFARLGVVALGAGLVIRITELAAAYLGADPPTHLPNASHLLVVGVGGSLLGLLVVREYPALVPDAAGRKGVGPRAFWILALGLALHSIAQPLVVPERPQFFAIVPLAVRFP